MEFQVGKAYGVAQEEHFFPVLPPVEGFIHPPLGVGGKRIADGGYKSNVRVVGMYFHRTDMAGFRQAQLCPVFAAVYGLIHPFAGNHIAANPVRACPCIDHRGLGGGNPDSPNRGRGEKTIGHVSPVLSVIVCFPNAPPGCPQEKMARFVRMPRYGGHTPTPGRADVPERHTVPGSGRDTARFILRLCGVEWQADPKYYGATQYNTHFFHRCSFIA